MSIDRYRNSRGYVWRRGAKDVGSLDFKTLALTVAPIATADETWDMNYDAEGLQPGELLPIPKTKDFIILGPEREFTHEVTLHACGNPDKREYTDIGAKKTVRVVGIEEACAATMAYHRRNDMGGGNCGKKHGEVWELATPGKKRTLVGRVRYNGGFETVAERKAFEAEMKAKYG